MTRVRATGPLAKQPLTRTLQVRARSSAARVVKQGHLSVFDRARRKR